MASILGKRTFKALFKQGWNEYPEVMCGCALAAVFGIGLSIYNVKTYYKHDGDNRRHKYTNVVMRSTDPRASKIRKDDYLKF